MEGCTEFELWQCLESFNDCCVCMRPYAEKVIGICIVILLRKFKKTLQQIEQEFRRKKLNFWLVIVEEKLRICMCRNNLTPNYQENFQKLSEYTIYLKK